MNNYLKERAMRRNSRMPMMNDGRNPYGSKGGYVTPTRKGRDRAMDYGNDYPEYYNGMDYKTNPQYPNADYHMGYKQYGQYPMPMYEMYGIGGVQPMYDYNYDYAYEGMDKEWKEDLHEWIEDLKKYDSFKMSKEDIINKARSMDVKFDKYNEHEFIATYYMMMSDHPGIINDPHIALAMAKDFLEGKNTELKGSEKLCAHFYEIVKGGKED